MRALMILSLLLMTACSDGDGDGDGGSGGVTGLWAWCDDEACGTLDDGGLFFSGGRVLDAYYDAEASTYCTYEQVGTYTVDGDMIVITLPADEGGGEETYVLEGSLLRGSSDLRRVQASAAPPASCPS